MSEIAIKADTAVVPLKKPVLQPGDLVAPSRLEQTWFGRVFDVSESTLRIWWNGLDNLACTGGLITHEMSEVTLVERPVQYLAVAFELDGDDRYYFVVAGDDVTDEESAFDKAERYTIVSRRTAQST